MTAKEMFKKLGYKEVICDFGFVYYINDDVVISFWEKLKTYNVSCKTKYKDTRIWLDAEEHQAIHKKLKELRWL